MESKKREATGRMAVRAGTASVLCLLLSSLAQASSAAAQVRMTQAEALRLAFPEPAMIERRTAFLSEEERKRVGELAGADVEVEDRVITYYLGLRSGQPLGVAYFDVHRVRTLPEVLMIVVDPQGEIERIEVLKFSEPPEYEAPQGWLDQFVGKDLSDGLSTRASIVNITGATLTARAVSRAARRALALHEVIRPLEAGRVGTSR